MITIQLQPKDSTTCGQHCVAMIANVPVSDSIKVFGHAHSTQTKEHRAALKHYGIDTAGRFKIFKLRKELPNICIIRFKHLNRSGSHVVVYYDGLIYCPSWGVYSFGQYVAWSIGHMKPTSFLEVFKTNAA